MLGRRLVVAASVAGVLLAGCGGSGDSSLGPGSALPDVTLPALDEGGEPLALADLTGPGRRQPVGHLVRAVPGRAARLSGGQRRPSRRAVRRRRHRRGRPDALAFLDDIGVDTDVFSQYGDPDAALTDALATTALPVTILLDGDDRIADIHLGPMTVDDLTAAIAEL